MREPTESELQAFKDAVEEKKKFYTRWREVKELAETTRDPVERSKQMRRAQVLHSMYREAAQRVKDLNPDFKPGKMATKRSQMGAPKSGEGLRVLMESGALWADLEGYTWSQLSGYTWGGKPVSEVKSEEMSVSQKLIKMVQDGIEHCTPRQQLYLIEYYVNKNSMDKIGEIHNVNKSTVSRCIHRAFTHIKNYISAKLLIQKCIDENGYFDYMKFVASAKVLTERQREYIFMMLAHDTSYADMARYLERHRSVVTRTSNRIEDRLGGVGVDVDIRFNNIKIKRQDWSSMTEKRLCEKLGLSPQFYYSQVCRKKMVGDIPMYHFYLLKKMQERPNVHLKEIAKDIGCSYDLLRKIQKQYEGIELPKLPLEAYYPETVTKVKAPENPYAAFGEGGALVDHINMAFMQQLHPELQTV